MPFDGSDMVRVRLLSPHQTAAQSAIVLDMMEFFFDGGRKWCRKTLETSDGKQCLLGSVEYVQRLIGYRDDDAVGYLARAINLRQIRKSLPPLGDSDGVTVIGFNDAYRRSFGDILEVLRQARELAMVDAFVRARKLGEGCSFRSSKRVDMDMD